MSSMRKTAPRVRQMDTFCSVSSYMPHISGVLNKIALRTSPSPNTSHFLFRWPTYFAPLWRVQDTLHGAISKEPVSRFHGVGEQ